MLTRFFPDLFCGAGVCFFLLGFALSTPTRGAGDLNERPLAAPSGPRGATLFKLLSPQETGLVTENSYADPKMWGERYNEFEVGAIGTGIAIGDYDGDGRPDIFVVSKTESCRLFRNLGNWKFEDVTEKAGVGDKGGDAMIWKQGATFVDVNNDGLLDIYLCRFGAPNRLYINQGDGTFKDEAAARGLAVNDASVMAAFCDYDRDGWLDVFIQTNLLDAATHPNGQKNYLFHNNRDGTFTNVTQTAGIAGEGQGHSAIWWDYDGDGWPDIYVSNDFGAPDKLYRNRGDGTFVDVIDSTIPHMPFSSMGSDLGDVNNDGLIDYFASDMAPTTHQKDQRTVAVMRAATRDLPADSSAAPQYMHNALYVNTGTGRFMEAAQLAGLAATDWTWAPRLEDLDNDGRLDLFVTNGMNRETHNADLTTRKLTAVTFAEKIQFERNSPVLNEQHFAFRNRGDLQFEDVSAAWGLNQKGVSFGSAFGDLDGDGDLDLVYSNFQNGITVLRNDSDTGHRVIFSLRGTASNRFGVGATIRIETQAGVQVRQLVLARGILSSSEPILHFGLGDDTVMKRVTVSWPSGRIQVFANLPADRRFTITEPAAAPGDSTMPAATNRSAQPPQFVELGQKQGLSLLSREMSVDETNQQPLLPLRQNRRGPPLAIGDLTGNGRDDVVVGGTPADPLRILVSTTTGEYLPADASKLVNDVGLDDGPILIFDADGDGTNDLLITKGGSALPAGSPDYQPRLFLNDGQGGFRPAPADALPALSISAGAAVTADFNRDGRLDVFIGARVLPGQYPLAPHSVLLANRGAKFEDVTDSVAPGLREIGMVTSALWTDVDGDGWLDLLVAVEWGKVRYFHNDGGMRLEDWTEKSGFGNAGTGWWTAIAAADFNGDGKLDYVVGNLGLNTEYKADADHPAVLFAGDFNGRGSLELVEASYESSSYAPIDPANSQLKGTISTRGPLYPRRTRKDLGASISAVMKKYPRNDFYARATLGEIFGEDKISSALRFEATEFRSGIFLSQSDGSYRFEPLPRLAQISPIQGLVAGDFDGDGHADIYAVQNSFAPIPSVGRFDGGLSQLLRGDGHGHFVAMPVAESGLLVPGDAKALVALDVDQDGWPDFLVSRNNGSTLFFRNRGAENRSSLRVELRGPAGNRTQIGARVTLELSDGSSQSSEVYGGSGYYSQSAGACFFGYAKSSPPLRLRVRWPSGKTTEQAVSAETKVVISTAPPE